MPPRPRNTLTVVVALALVLVGPAMAHAVPCPTTVTFEGATSSDLGFSGVGHGVDTGALAIPLAVSGCAGAEAGSCGVCDVGGPLLASDGRNRRCRGDLSIQCLVDADCGGAGPCRTYAGPPGPIEAGATSSASSPRSSGPSRGRSPRTPGASRSPCPSTCA